MLNPDVVVGAGFTAAAVDLLGKSVDYVAHNAVGSRDDLVAGGAGADHINPAERFVSEKVVSNFNGNTILERNSINTSRLGLGDDSQRGTENYHDRHNATDEIDWSPELYSKAGWGVRGGFSI
jgi:hypothetical protein